jgi:hypothetical protein
MLVLMGQMSRSMLEGDSHIPMTAKRDALAGVTLRQKGENSEVVPVKVPVKHRPLCSDRDVLERFGERGRNRTYNLLIKSQLLCQLSYAPFWVGPSGMEIFWRGSANSRPIHCILTPLFKQARSKQAGIEDRQRFGALLHRKPIGVQQ